MSVLRDWTCKNPECANDFESKAQHPYCPKCKSVSAWRPSGGHSMSPATGHADRTLRQVANRFGLTNLKSAREGEAAHPGLDRGKGNYGKFMGVDVTDRPTAGFADWGTSKIGAPVGGSGKFKSSGRRLPTDVKHIDPTPLKL